MSDPYRLWGSRWRSAVSHCLDLQLTIELIYDVFLVPLPIFQIVSDKGLSMLLSLEDSWRVRDVAVLRDAERRSGRLALIPKRESIHSQDSGLRMTKC